MSTPNPALDELHLPVLAARCLQLLEGSLAAPGAVLVDATLGMGGHSKYLLERLPNLRVIGIDRDAQARAVAAQRLAPFADRVTIAGATYDQLEEVLEACGVESVDGILADLGVSSLQLDQAERGFSYAQDAPLDMRMNQESGFTAAELLAQAEASEIRRILWTWGEEKFAAQIAQAIVRQRENKPLQTTAELVELIRQTIPAPARRQGGNPAKRSFQALRIAVNGELDSLTAFLPRALERLKVGGHMVVESYQSLEDRLVKQAFKQGISPTQLWDLPVALPQTQPWLRGLTKGAEKADEAEIARNSRAASVRLRAVAKLGPARWENEADKAQFTTKFPVLSRLRPAPAPVHCEKPLMDDANQAAGQSGQQITGDQR